MEKKKILLLTSILLFVFGNAFSQTYGCTDPLSFNYDPEATVHDERQCKYIIFDLEDDISREQVGVEGGSFGFTVTANKIWTISIESRGQGTEGIKIEYEGNVSGQALTGNGDGQGTIHIPANTLPDQRNFGIQIQVIDGTYENGGVLYFEISQAGTGIYSGCTDPTAANYNSAAVIDDGSCLYGVLGCMDPASSSYNPLATIDDGSCEYLGCTDSYALNYDPLATKDDGSCIYPVYGCTDPTATNYDPQANVNEGCVYPLIYVENMDNGGAAYIGLAGGSLKYKITTDSTWTITLTGDGGVAEGMTIEPEIYSGTGNAQGTIVIAPSQEIKGFRFVVSYLSGNWQAVNIAQMDMPGCTDPTSENYNPQANVDDGSCIYKTTYGCTDPLAFNYDQLATVDNGSCQCVSLEVENIKSGGQLNVSAEGGSFGFTITSNKTWVMSIDPEGGAAITYEGTTSESELTGFGNGQGAIVIASNTSEQKIIGIRVQSTDGGNIEYIRVLQSGTEIYSGCTDPQAINYDPQATSDNGSCEYSQQQVFTPDSINFTSDGGSMIFAIAVDGNWTADVYSDWITTTKDSANSTLLVIVDGNTGVARSYNVELYSEDKKLLGILKVTQDGITPVYGCTDPEALNYNSQANTDDGRCQYDEETVYGCTDPTALNYNPQATVNQGCEYVSFTMDVYDVGQEGGSIEFAVTSKVAWKIEKEDFGYGVTDIMIDPMSGSGDAQGMITITPNPIFEDRSFVFHVLTFDDTPVYSALIKQAARTTQSVYGCTDRFAENYDPRATVNDSTCIYRKIEEPITGCTDPTALNYNAVATVADNNDCIYETTEPQPVYGCTDIKALNFNVNATDYEEGSCVYADEENIYNEIITEEPVDTVGTKAAEDCDLNASLSIISAIITDIDFIDEYKIIANWKIEQANGNVVYYSAEYTVTRSGNTLFYLSIICKNGMLRSTNNDVTGYTVSAPYDVNLGDPTKICLPEIETTNLTVYPNPFSDKLTVLIKNSQTADITLYSVDGKPLANYSNLNEVQIATSKLPAGVYIIKVTVGGKAETVTVVKK